MKIGLIGLGKMGQQIVGRLQDAGHEVVVSDVNPAAVTTAASAGAIPAADLADLVKKLGPDPAVWIMIPHEQVENTISALIGLMPAGGTIIDGGNSDYRETKRRAVRAAERGVHLVDAGVSGGVLGRSSGFAIMVGGDKDTVDRLQPIFESLSQPSGWGYMGPAGAGHFVKMVHNAVEYALMEAYAEGYRFLKDNPDFDSLNLAQIAGIWEHGSIIASKLNDLTGQVLRANPELAGIDGFVASSGEADWTLEAATAAHIPLPAVQTAVNVRLASQKGDTNFATKLLAGMRNAFGGHALNKPPKP